MSIFEFRQVAVDRWDYTIRAFYPGLRGLAIETVHRGEASRDIEISVFRDRMRRGDLAYIEIIDHADPSVPRRISRAEVIRESSP